ncbi:MAG: hypothetical protein ACRC3B_13730 [Bacteroidia bacterium]
MKKDKWFLLIGLAALLVVLVGLGWLLLREKLPVTHIEIPAQLLESAEPSQFSVQPVDVVRASPGASVLVFFPPVKRETRVRLFDERAYTAVMAGSFSAKPLYLADAERLRIVHGRPVINFSNLPDGNYYAHLSACNYGGYFCFRVMSKK